MAKLKFLLICVNHVHQQVFCRLLKHRCQGAKFSMPCTPSAMPLTVSLTKSETISTSAQAIRPNEDWDWFKGKFTGPPTILNSYFHEKIHSFRFRVSLQPIHSKMANWGNEISGKFQRLSTSFNSSGWYHWLTMPITHHSVITFGFISVMFRTIPTMDWTEKKPLKKWFGTRRGGNHQAENTVGIWSNPSAVGSVQTWGTTQLMASSMVKNGTMIINHQVFRISVDRDRPSWFHGLCRLTWTHLASNACN